MSDEASQTTLNPSLGSTEQAIARLDLIEVAAWCAFERSRTVKLPSCPSFELARALIERLEHKGVLRLGDRGGSTALVRAIYDPLSWHYEGMDDLGSLQPNLQRRLYDLSASADQNSIKLDLWRELAWAEACGYLRHLLMRQSMEGDWATALLQSIGSEMEALPLGKQRYVVWAGVRQGSATYLRCGGDWDRVYESIQNDMRRRARWVAIDPSPQIGFVPAQGWRRSILLSLFIDEMTTLGEHYWRLLPSLEAIETFPRA